MQSAGIDRLVLTESTEEAACRRGNGGRERERERDLCLGSLGVCVIEAGVGGSAPHFHARRQGKQTGPCSAVTWLALPPLLWVL